MATGGDDDRAGGLEEELEPAADAPQVDFEPAEAEPGEDPTRVRRITFGAGEGGDRGDDDGEGFEEPSPDVPGKMSRERFAQLTVFLWSVPGMKDDRLKPLAVTREDPEERQEGALATGRFAYDMLKSWAPFLIPPPLEGSEDATMAAIFLFGQWRIYQAILYKARAEAARDVSEEAQREDMRRESGL